MMLLLYVAYLTGVGIVLLSRRRPKARPIGARPKAGEGASPTRDDQGEDPEPDDDDDRRGRFREPLLPRQFDLGPFAAPTITSAGMSLMTRAMTAGNGLRSSRSPARL